MDYVFSDLLNAFAELHCVADNKRPAFIARLQHMQKMKFPPGTNAGRGRAAKYRAEHALLVAIALELNQFGLTPDKATKIIYRSLGFLCEGILETLDPTPIHLASEIVCFVPPRNLDDLSAGAVTDFGLTCQSFAEWLKNSKEEIDPQKNLGRTWRTSFFSFSSLLYVLPELIRRDDPQHAIEFWEALRQWAEPIVQLHKKQQEEEGYLFRHLDGVYTPALLALA